MSKLAKLKYATGGFLLGATFFTSVAFAASENIEVSFDKLRFLINGVDKTTSDGMYDNNGTKVPASLIYSGTTYIPFRMAGEMLGKPVDWDGTSKTVLIGSNKGEGVYLSDLAAAKTYNDSSYVTTNSNMVLNEQTYSKGFKVSWPGRDGKVSATYNLDAKYKNFSALLGLQKNTGGKGYSVIISGDGKELYNVKLMSGISPQDLNLDVSGVLQLTLTFQGYDELYLVNPYLKK